MLNSSSPQSARIPAPTAPRGRDRRDGHPARGEPTDQQGWDELVAREAMHQEVIEASFDRAEAYERLGDFQQALEWLDRAAALGGGLPPAYQAKRARWARAAALRPRPAAGGWENRLGVTEGAPAT
jgi:tetratricopeptide (TPR) repeat protein